MANAVGEPATSPAATRLTEPGDHPVAVPVTCVITRFGLRSARDLLPTYLDYRRVAREAARTPGLLRAAFLVEGPAACYSLSLWASRDAIPHFGTNVPGHVEAARRVFRRLRFDERRGPEIWSTKWRLDSVSNNLNWADFDLRGLILGTDT
ncbi:MAG TPA: hypothetical protein VFL91_17130 [Thermomicrobiales bacterium]|nr:hypothetical protein [Thermomicrobiales bacterium]